MNRALTFTLIGLAASLFACATSSTLLRMHAVGTSDLGILAGACGEDGASCSKVISSRWGVFPPRAADEPAPDEGTDAGTRVADPSDGIPVAALGLFYFTGLALWFGLIGRPTGRAVHLHRALKVLSVFGGIASLTFLGLMFASVGLCSLCLMSHLANFVIIAALFLLPTGDPSAPTMPRPRLAATFVVLLLAAWTAEWKGYRAARAELYDAQLSEVQKNMGEVLERDAQQVEVAQLQQEVQDLRSRLGELEELKNDADRLEALHLQEEPVELDIRDDDPRIEHHGGRRMQIVMFGDIECEHCAEFYDFLRAEVLPLFRGNLEVVYKHLPLSVHKNAIPGARALEAARVQGKFWEMHDYLHDRREQLSSVDYLRVAGELGLDVSRFEQDLRSDELMRRINEDIRTGMRLGLKSTPAVFLNGRPVKKLFRSNIGFWKLRADIVRRSRERANQSW
ncbi:MAG: thioredoxin domain-containing protein [Planctomycetes bacterium]|nr:thioredoxin domain-containing protein [Planctomycetota bacterium]